jgi:hypothetical protein
MAFDFSHDAAVKNITQKKSKKYSVPPQGGLKLGF